MQNKTFSYTYSAKEMDELKKIREKYCPKENRLEQLRKLDASVGEKGMLVSLSAGISGCLLAGVGMCSVLLWQGGMFIPGILLGVAGFVLLAAALPLYNRTVKAERKKIAPEILRLTDELMK